MWTMIPSLRAVVDSLAPAFTQPSFATSCQLLLAWVMCLGKHTLLRVGRTARPEQAPDDSVRHGLDPYYNFYERSAWAPKDLAYRVALLILTRLIPFGPVTVLVDDTLAHKRGKSVWGMGWFRDAVASTQKRVATASSRPRLSTTRCRFLPSSFLPPSKPRASRVPCESVVWLSTLAVVRPVGLSCCRTRSRRASCNRASIPSFFHLAK